MRKLTEDEKERVSKNLSISELCPSDIFLPDYYKTNKCIRYKTCESCWDHALNFLRIAETEDE